MQPHGDDLQEKDQKVTWLRVRRRNQTNNQAMPLPQESYHVNGGQVFTQTDCGAFKVATVHVHALKRAQMQIKLKRR